jgi:hypothetical protein
MSNLGKWAPWYAGLAPDTPAQAYGDSESYRIGAEWLKDCAVVEDWGCGLGWFRQFLPYPLRYVGIDGTASPFPDIVADLAEYTSETEGIFMRGVIEHDYQWQKILRNAYKSFTWRMCLVLFTPMVDEGPKEIAFVDEIGVPDLSFSLANVLYPLVAGAVVADIREIESPNTGYGGETIFLMEK